MIVWSIDVAPAPAPRRPQDRAFVGNIVQAMAAYANGELGEQAVPYGDGQRIIAIGSDRMMRAVKEARHTGRSPASSPRSPRDRRASTRRCSA